MTGHARGGLEVADIFARYGSEYLAAFGNVTTTQKKRVLRNVATCRTAALGGHKKKCNECGHEEIAYNSCRDRHCPKCQGSARAKWTEAQAADLLPVPYFHVVFTLPHPIAPIALQNRRIVYNILFRAASRTLLQIVADPNHLGAQIGFLAVLHTWGQTLTHHPHMHCLIPGGGISTNNVQWIRSRPRFFLPVRVLSRVFRGIFLAQLRRAYQCGELVFHGSLGALGQPDRFEQQIRAARRTDWVVYAQPPFGGPEQVLKYLARYTHRVAISNSRLISMCDGKVSFRWKDYADSNRTKTMALEATEFIRRFLLHVLPSGFMRIRHFGFLANRSRQVKLQLARQLLGGQRSSERDHVHLAHDGGQVDAASTVRAEDHNVCPVCAKGRLTIIERIPRPRHDTIAPVFASVTTAALRKAWDTS